MSEVLNFQWPSRRDEPVEDEVVPEAWNDPHAAPPDAAQHAPDDEVLVLWLDRAIARRRIEQLGMAYAGALEIIDAQRRRLLAMQRQPENLPPSPSRLPPRRRTKASWLERLFGINARPDPRSRPRNR